MLSIGSPPLLLAVAKKEEEYFRREDDLLYNSTIYRPSHPVVIHAFPTLNAAIVGLALARIALVAACAARPRSESPGSREQRASVVSTPEARSSHGWKVRATDGWNWKVGIGILSPPRNQRWQGKDE
ncbi:hypothetical protein Cni_G18341 [Canna indica]|uniref:Uncharacterized protein n=1 Tax=Canna indica TaxID=4628 RepID=A0AAQ3KIP6_9LILI|nr:hypothetical protein Cni_G18341 [Canna indica]